MTFALEETATGRRHNIVSRRFRIGGDMDDDLVILGLEHEGMTLLFRRNGEVWWSVDGTFGELDLDEPFEIGGVSLVVRAAPVRARARSHRPRDPADQPTDPDIRIPPHLLSTSPVFVDDELPTDFSCQD